MFTGNGGSSFANSNAVAANGPGFSFSNANANANSFSNPSLNSISNMDPFPHPPHHEDRGRNRLGPIRFK